MSKVLKTPLLSVNAKSYMSGDDLLDIALYCDELAKEHDISVSINVPYVDIYRIAQAVDHVLINAQGMDAIEPGDKMGGIVPEALKAAGADGVIINHASRPMLFNDVIRAVERCKEVGLSSIVCVETVVEAKMVAALHPTAMVVEQAKLIGTGVLADEDYYEATTSAIKAIDENILVIHGAGIKNGDDVYYAIKNGSESGGGASGIFLSEDPKATIADFARGILKAKAEFGSRIVK